jgi:L-ascorbate metabolism protein UlaG (beta-lactamase superfamily)
LSTPQAELAAALSAIDDTKPTLTWNDKRADAFRRLELVLNTNCGEGQPCDLYYVNPNPVWEAVVPRIEATIRDAKTADVPREVMQLWQLYSSGMLVKSGNQVLGFDVIPMPPFFGWTEPEGLTERIANVLDALFITHRHEDHCDAALIQACLRRGIPVFLPDSIADSISPSPHLHPMTDGLEVSAGDAQVTGRLGFHVWREAINSPQLIYYEVTLPNGYALIFGGDVDYTKRFERTGGKHINLIVIPWRAPNQRFEEGHAEQEATILDAIASTVERMRPDALLHNHYGELDHIYSWGTGASYSMALNLKRGCPTPSEVLFWGESILLKHP